MIPAKLTAPLSVDVWSPLTSSLLAPETLEELTVSAKRGGRRRLRTGRARSRSTRREATPPHLSGSVPRQRSTPRRASRPRAAPLCPPAARGSLGRAASHDPKKSPADVQDQGRRALASTNICMPQGVWGVAIGAGADDGYRQDVPKGGVAWPPRAPPRPPSRTSGRRSRRSAASISTSPSSSTCMRGRARSSSPLRTSTTSSPTAPGSPASRPARSARCRATRTLLRSPISASFTPVPWEPTVARFACDITVDGEEWPYDPRTILRRQLGAARDQGFEFKMGLELEYFLIELLEDGSIRLEDALDTLEKPCYDLNGLSRHYDFLTTVSRYVNELGGTTRTTTRTRTASSSRTSRMPTRSRAATARSSSATWFTSSRSGKAARRDGTSSRRLCRNRSRT